MHTHLFVTFILFVVAVCAYKNTNEGKVSSFTMVGGDKGTQSVAVKNAHGEKITCVFTYDSYTAEKKPQEVNAKSLVESITRKLTGECLPYQSGIFHYEFCLGDEMKQTADEERYSLGKFTGRYANDDKPPKQLYTEGTLCGAASNQPRSTAVEFTCSDDVRVISLQEPSTCQYRLIIGTPEVCGHSAFVAVTGNWETWVLEIDEMAEGGFICQVFNNGFDSADTVQFSSFKLQLKNTELNLDNYAIRHKNRKIMDGSKIKTQETPPTLQSSDSFGNTPFDYAYIKSESDL